MKLTRQDLVLAIANQACREAGNSFRMIGLMDAVLPCEGEELERLRAKVEGYGVDDLHTYGDTYIGRGMDAVLDLKTLFMLEPALVHPANRNRSWDENESDEDESDQAANSFRAWNVLPQAENHSIRILNLRTRIINCLQARGIETVRELYRAPNRTRSIGGISSNAFLEIKIAFMRLGILWPAAEAANRDDDFDAEPEIPLLTPAQRAGILPERLESLALFHRTALLLKDAGYRSIGDILEASVADLLRISEFDREALNDLRNALTARGIDVKDYCLVVTDPDVMRALRTKSLRFLSLSTRTINALTLAGFETIDDVMKLSGAELLKLRNFGRKSFNELNAALIEFGAAAEVHFSRFP